MINKYKNNKSEKYGRKWDSEMELDFYETVCIPALRSGEYISVDTQVVFVIQESFMYRGKKIQPIKYKADFLIITSEGEEIIVDVKGMPPTTDFKIKWKIMKFKYNQYTYKCLKGLGRNKRKGVMHYNKWEEVKGVV